MGEVTAPAVTRIRELRESAGLSQEALGERVGVTRQTVAAWERG
jgi:DNA-binding XRE family transcriptional regulator